MSGSVNKVILIGNLGDDVKMHHFDNNNCIGKFPVATSETFTKKETGEKITQTEWHQVITRNKLAELCEKYLSKGASVYVEGKLKTRKWDDNGTMKYVTEVHASMVQFLGSAGNNNKSSGQDEEMQQEDTPF